MKSYQLYKKDNRIRIISSFGKIARGYWFDGKSGIKQEDLTGADKGFFMLANIKSGKCIGFVELFEDPICSAGKVKVTNAYGNIDFLKKDAIYPYIKNKETLNF